MITMLVLITTIVMLALFTIAALTSGVVIWLPIISDVLVFVAVVVLVCKARRK